MLYKYSQLLAIICKAVIVRPSPVFPHYFFESRARPIQVYGTDVHERRFPAITHAMSQTTEMIPNISKLFAE